MFHCSLIQFVAKNCLMWKGRTPVALSGDLSLLHFFSQVWQLNLQCQRRIAVITTLCRGTCFSSREPFLHARVVVRNWKLFPSRTAQAGALTRKSIRLAPYSIRFYKDSLNSTKVRAMSIVAFFGCAFSIMCHASFWNSIFLKSKITRALP